MFQSQEHASSHDEGEKTILVVEDEASIRDLLCDVLSSDGYAVLTASGQTEIFHEIDSHPIDLITLDLNLGREDGLDIAREIRKVTNIPIVMITGRDQPIERVAGLEQGADDYITKPFHVKEVLIRVKSVLARYSQPMIASHAKAHDTRLTAMKFDHHILDGKRRLLVHADGSEIHLTETEFEILAMFLENPGRILSRDEIWFALRHQERDPLDRTLDGHIAHLRKKIDESGCLRLHINSVRGVGYVFIGGPDAESAP